jgi:DNA modification methylase
MTSKQWIKISSLVFFPGNPRTIDDMSRERLKHSIKKFTSSLDESTDKFRLADPVIVNDCNFFESDEGKNWILGGNQRCTVLLEMGQEVIHRDDIRWLHINDRQMAISLNIALNNPAMAGEYDDYKLKEMLLELSEDWMNSAGFDDDSLKEIIERLLDEEGPKDGLIDDDEIPEPTEAICKTGDLWQLGEHRLLCGDATSKDDVSRLMNGEKADMFLNDPPYYKIKSEDWDNQWENFEKFISFIKDISLIAKDILKNSGSYYIFGDDEIIAYIQVELDKHFTFLNHLVWHKPNNMPIKYAFAHRKYCPMSERILFYSIQDATGLATIHSKPECFESIKQYMREERDKIIKKEQFKTQEEFNSLINKLTGTSSVVSRHYFADSQYLFPTKEMYTKLQTTGFFMKEYEELREEYEELREEYEELRRPFSPQPDLYEVISEPIITQKENTEHPTTKPVRLIEKFVAVSSSPSFPLVVDMFGGSGTTLIACEKLNRKCRMMEIDPHYCDVIINRWEQFTGNKAELIQ